MTSADTPQPAPPPESADLDPWDGSDGSGRPILNVVAGDVPADALGIDDLGSQIIGMAGRLAAATCRWLLLVAAFDAREGQAKFGLPTAARWLSHYCGLSARTAKEHVRVARALSRHAALAESMGSGRLSYSHIRAISRIADAGSEQLVENLIEVAEQGTVGQLEDVVRGLRTVDDANSDLVPLDPEYLSHSWGGDSRWRLSARIDPENGALVQSALEVVARRESLTMAQALVRIAEIALAAAAEEDGELKTLRGHELAAVVIHLDAAAVPSATTDAPDAPDAPGAVPVATAVEQGCSAEHPEQPNARRRPFARVERGPGLPERVVTWLLCGGRIRTAVHSPDGSMLDLGRSHRLVSVKLFMALLDRDGGCAHPGCHSRHGLEAHHVLHWLYGGRTDLKNLLLLCRRHHHAHHDGEFSIASSGSTPSSGRSRDSFEFRRADGQVLLAVVDPTTLAGASAAIEHEHSDVAPNAASTRWDGARLDRRYAVDTLAAGLSPRETA